MDKYTLQSGETIDVSCLLDTDREHISRIEKLIADGLILAPLEQIEPMREFLQSWEIEYTYIPTLIPQRMNKKRILED